MNNHLSSDQIHRLVIGDATREDEQHARECDQCSRKLMRLTDVLSLFRDSVQYRTQQAKGASVPDRAFVLCMSNRWVMRPLRWVLAAGVLITVIAFPVYKNARDRHRLAQAAEDAVLLERVNADLARAVPAPMERFVVLLSDDSGNEVGGRQ